eukprot:1587331-Pleurochrysis_carterae.AAC.1
MHALVPKPGGLYLAISPLAIFALLSTPARAMARMVLFTFLLRPPLHRLRHSTRSPPQGNKCDRVLSGRLSYRARSTPLSCARDDALHRMFSDVVKSTRAIRRG